MSPVDIFDSSAPRRKLQWQADQVYRELPIKPADILIDNRIPGGIKLQCIDGRFKADEGEVYLRIPGGGLGLVADVHTALSEVWGQQYLQAHEEQLIAEMMDFFGGRIVGHSDEKGCETGFCGCGHLKQTVYSECERADVGLRNFLLRISKDDQVFERHVLSGDHLEKKVIHAGKFDVSSSIGGVQAFVYHDEYHQAMIEAMSRRLAVLIARVEGEEELNREITSEHAERISEVMKEVSGARLEATVDRLAKGFEHVRRETPNENEFEDGGKAGRARILKQNGWWATGETERSAEAI